MPIKQLYKYFFITILLCSSMLATAQELSKDKIILKTGEVYIGDIINRNEEILTLKTLNGSRFQFPLREIKNISKAELSDTLKSNDEQQNSTAITNKDVFGLVEILAGASFAKNKFNILPASQISLSFGSLLKSNKSIYAGVGLGYFNIFNSTEAENIGFVPVFFRLKNNFSPNRKSTFVMFDAGYAFSANNNYSGGLYSKLATGISRKFNSSNTILIGAFASLNGFSGKLTETTDTGSYYYNGNTTAFSLGINLGLQF